MGYCAGTPTEKLPSSELLYKSNRPQVSVSYRLINHLGCWYNTRRIRKPRACSLWFRNCAVSENIYTPPTEGIGISWWMGGSGRSKNIMKCMKLYWNFQRGGEVLKKTLPWGRCGYFLELHILLVFYQHPAWFITLHV